MVAIPPTARFIKLSQREPRPRVRGPGQIGMLISICKGKGLLGIGGQEVEDKGETV